MYKYDPFQHCCPTMNARLDPECHVDELSLVEYNPDTRSYRFVIRYDNGESHGARLSLMYCPWCGKKLPKTLGDEWEEILKNEYGMTIKDLFNKNGRWDELKVPEELRTDEWWKKRNL